MAVQTGSIYVVKEHAKNEQIEVLSMGHWAVKLRLPKGKAGGAGFPVRLVFSFCSFVTETEKSELIGFLCFPRSYING